MSEGSATNDTVGAVSNIRIQRGDDGDNPEVVSDTAGMERELVDGTPRNKLWRTDEEETVGTRTIAAAPTTEPATDESYRASALTSGTGSRVGGRGGRQGTRAGGGNRTSVGGIGSTRTGDGVRAIVVAPPTCEVCERKDGDVRVDKELLEGFGVSVCWGCKVGSLPESYRYINDFAFVDYGPNARHVFGVLASPGRWPSVVGFRCYGGTLTMQGTCVTLCHNGMGRVLLHFVSAFTRHVRLLWDRCYRTCHR